VKWNAGYRLPTEAEWEKAGRGGLSGRRFPWGDTISISQANYFSCSNCYPYDLSNVGYTNTYYIYNDGVTPYTSPVDAFAPNGYGLYDLAGNAVDWCWDWYAAYSSAPQTNPQGPATGSSRLTRGGCWCHYAESCRVSNRRYWLLTYTDDGASFRTVLAPVQP
jgi:formylglycine-generating enzyme required for sulfatase activity